MAGMQRQLQEQGDQLDCLVAELAARGGGERLPVGGPAGSGGRGDDGDAEAVAELEEQVCGFP
jgi:hypothetical protein